MSEASQRVGSNEGRFESLRRTSGNDSFTGGFVGSEGIGRSIEEK